MKMVVLDQFWVKRGSQQVAWLSCHIAPNGELGQHSGLPKKCFNLRRSKKDGMGRLSFRVYPAKGRRTSIISTPNFLSTTIYSAKSPYSVRTPTFTQVLYFSCFHLESTQSFYNQTNPKQITTRVQPSIRYLV